MQVGDSVEVHTRFNDSWTTGFVIAHVTDDGYRVARRSDGTLLPGSTSEADVRITRPAAPQWFGQREELKLPDA